jgi:hypothetical protein
MTARVVLRTTDREDPHMLDQAAHAITDRVVQCTMDQVVQCTTDRVVQCTTDREGLHTMDRGDLRTMVRGVHAMVVRGVHAIPGQAERGNSALMSVESKLGFRCPCFSGLSSDTMG